jgi:DNA-binding MarR family transcriptional regulator
MAEPVEQIIRFMNVVRGIVADENARDYSLRQIAVMMAVYTSSDRQTVRGLAAALRISKPAVSRALDRLAENDLVRRQDDPADRRSIFVTRTPVGNQFMRKIAKLANAPISGVPANARSAAPATPAATTSDASLPIGEAQPGA